MSITEILWKLEGDYRPGESEHADARVAEAEKELQRYIEEQIIGEDDTSKQSPHVEARVIRNELRAEQRARLRG